MEGQDEHGFEIPEAWARDCPLSICDLRLASWGTCSRGRRPRHPELWRGGLAGPWLFWAHVPLPLVNYWHLYQVHKCRCVCVCAYTEGRELGSTITCTEREKLENVVSAKKKKKKHLMRKSNKNDILTQLLF